LPIKISAHNLLHHSSVGVATPKKDVPTAEAQDQDQRWHQDKGDLFGQAGEWPSGNAIEYAIRTVMDANVMDGTSLIV
jgi:hypothetical protein